MTSVMLVDDHAMLREGLREKFKECIDINVVAEASSAQELLDYLSLHGAPDVIVLDIKLPDSQGFRLIKKIKQSAPQTRMVVLTMFNHPRYAVHSLEAGADGFVVKGAPFEELARAVRAVHGGKNYVCDEMSPDLIGHVMRSNREDMVEGLSEREFEVLHFLGDGLSTKETALRLGISVKTVGTYRTRLMKKLLLANQSEIVRFALQNVRD